MIEGERTELDEQTQRGEHNVLDEDKMAENRLEGSLEIENVLRMECSKINIPLVCPLFLLFPHGGFSTACFFVVVIVVLLLITQDVISWEDTWGMEPPKHT